eukprot:702255-Pelagomonas_calceolata.AAC.3
MISQITKVSDWAFLCNGKISFVIIVKSSWSEENPGWTIKFRSQTSRVIKKEHGVEHFVHAMQASQPLQEM